jgi:hypothetical protein
MSEHFRLELIAAIIDADWVMDKCEESLVIKKADLFFSQSSHIIANLSSCRMAPATTNDRADKNHAVV